MTVGIAPANGSGPALQDGQWLLGVAAGNNRAYKNGVTATGTTKAGAFQLPAGVQLIEIDTVAANSGVLMPAAVAGQIVMIFNSGANTLNIWGRGTDTIGNTATATARTMAANASAVFFCAKNGSWGATALAS